MSIKVRGENILPEKKLSDAKKGLEKSLLMDYYQVSRSLSFTDNVFLFRKPIQIRISGKFSHVKCTTH